NFLTLRDALKEYAPETIRFYFLSAHYRSPLEYDHKSLPQARTAVNRVADFVNRLKETTGPSSPFPVDDFTGEFWKQLEDDFATPGAFAAMFDLIKEANKSINNHSLSGNDAKKIIDFINQVNDIFGILPSEETAPAEVTALTAEREKARAEKDFAKSDELREQIKKLGWEVEDTPTGPKITKK
ncbi:MAG: DALR domain-containing protein, partial [Patescibacteria group bacterium]